MASTEGRKNEDRCRIAVPEDTFEGTPEENRVTQPSEDDTSFFILLMTCSINLLRSALNQTRKTIHNGFGFRVNAFLYSSN
jgi:hypothetical protein